MAQKEFVDEVARAKRVISTDLMVEKLKVKRRHAVQGQNPNDFMKNSMRSPIKDHDQTQS
jgi:hypothetical protein